MQTKNSKKGQSGFQQITTAQWIIGILVLGLVLLALVRYSGLNLLRFLPDYNNYSGSGTGGEAAQNVPEYTFIEEDYRVTVKIIYTKTEILGAFMDKWK